MSIRYETKIVSPQKGWLFIYIPNDILGVKKRVWLKGKLNGKEFVATANPWKNDTHVITFNREMRKQLGIYESVDVILEFDISEKPLLDVNIPDDFLKALSDNKTAEATFNKLPPSHQKEFVFYINEAKTAATRQKHIRRSIQMLEKDRHLYEDPAQKFPDVLS